jgi:hypothetical protein
MLKILPAKALVSAAVLGLAILPLAASAGEVDHRINDQQARIQQGWHDGALTRGEYFSTEGRLLAINAQRRHDLRANGGSLTWGEKIQLNREENGLSRRIYIDKHNRAERF